MMGLRDAGRLGVGLFLMSAGCFSSPPSSGSGGEASTGNVSGPGVTGDSLSVSETQVTSISGSASSTHSGDSSSSSTSSTAADSTSSDTTSSGDTSTADVGCPEGTTEVDGFCLAPFAVIDTISSTGPLVSYADACITESCPGGGLPLAAGFEAENVSLRGLAVEIESSAAEVCGVEDPGNPNQWAAAVHCAIGEVDVLSALDVGMLSNGDSVCVVSACPTGTTLVGGGGRWMGSFELRGSRPLGTNRWEVCGDAYGEAEVETEALCAVLPVGVTTAVFAEVANVPAGGSTACVEAQCPEGMLLAGGGRMALGSGLFRSAPDPDAEDGWQACGFNGAGLSIEVESQVLCLQN